MQRVAIVGLIVMGCGSIERPIESSGEATVKLFNRDGVEIASWPVMFQGADGSQRQIVLTDRFGEAVGPMEPDGMVTYRSPFPGDELVTRGRVQPGDVIFDGARPSWAPPRYRVVVGTPDAPANARLCTVRIACNDHLVESRGVPGAEIAVAIPQACTRTAPDGQVLVYALVTATDERAEVASYAVFPSLSVGDEPTHAVVDRWRTDAAEISVTLTGFDTDFWMSALEVRSSVHAMRIAERRDFTRTIGEALSVRFPTGIPAPTSYRVSVQLLTGERDLERHDVSSDGLALAPGDLLPSLTSIDLVRAHDGPPSLSFTSERPITEPSTIDAVLLGNHASWRLLNFAGPTVVLPELDTSPFPFLPYFTTDDLELHQLQVTVDAPDGVRSTSIPYAIDDAARAL